MGQALCSAPAGHRVAFCYERRRPEETTLYQVVQEQIATFLAQVEAKTGAGLPEFVKDEFEAYLECGILAHGFLRVRCADCAHEKLVAFSCKRRVPGRSGHLARAGTPLGAVVSDPAAPPLRRPSATARAGATEYPSEHHGRAGYGAKCAPNPVCNTRCCAVCIGVGWIDVGALM